MRIPKAEIEALIADIVANVDVDQEVWEALHALEGDSIQRGLERADHFDSATCTAADFLRDLAAGMTDAEAEDRYGEWIYQAEIGYGYV
jgi:hypothetical protein